MTQGAEVGYYCGFFFILLISFLSGCGNTFEKLDDGMTTVTISGPARAPNLMSAVSSLQSYWGTAAALDGGGMIYAARADNHFAVGRKPFGPGGEISWTLPNGVYYFYALGFQTPFGNPGTLATLHCGMASGPEPLGGVRLTGSPTNVEMILRDSSVTGSACDNPPFNSGSRVSTIVVTSSSVVSLQIALFAGDDFDGRGQTASDSPAYLSRCTYPVTSTPYVDLTANGMPGIWALGTAVGLDRPIKFEILAFGDAGCTAFLHRYTFPLGLNAADGIRTGSVVRDGVTYGPAAEYFAGTLALP